MPSAQQRSCVPLAAYSHQVTVENQNDMDGILKVGSVVAQVRDTMLAAIEPGMTTAELDANGSKNNVGYFDPSDTRKLQYGQVIAVEPFISTKSTYARETNDGWTLVGHPGNRSAQFEHTVIVTRGQPIVATRSAASH